MKGRVAENRGLGIGAFAYYRRVIENQKEGVFDTILDSAKSIPGHSDVVDQLEKAKEADSFKSAVGAMIRAQKETVGLNSGTLRRGAKKEPRDSRWFTRH